MCDAAYIPGNIEKNHIKVLGPHFLNSRCFRSFEQCCGSGRFLFGFGSGSDFRLDPDTDPDLSKISGCFLLKMFFLAEICSKMYIHEPKSIYGFYTYLPKKLI
jgi:hypothetical protein